MAGESLFHCVRCIINVDSSSTQTSPDERKALIKYTSTAKSIAEIGVFEGYNTREFAINSPAEAVIYAIDPFFKGKLGLSYLKIIAVNDWKKHHVRNKIKIIRGLSWDVFSRLDKTFDFIFIDGDHSFEAVKRDFELYSTKLAAGGTIAFHDARVFNNGWTKADWGPVRLIEEIIKSNKGWRIVEQVDSAVFIQRV